ncbi:MAG: dTDP-4-dehydrorhamnose reductase [Anaerolineales bacterium]
MKILLIGNTGQVGWELQRTLAPLGSLTAIDYPDINLTDMDNTRAWVRRVQPNVIVNAAAYTAVDKAESDLATAHAINATAAGVLAEEAKTLGAAMIHYSTDFVFDGNKTTPYVETDPTNPLGAYGQTKRDGEIAVEQVGGASITLRTAWVYSTRRPSFVTKTLEWARKFPELRIVTDQIGCPTWCRLLAEATALVIAMGGKHLTPWLTERRGIYHLAGDGGCSRYEWAQAILKYDPHPELQTAKALLPALTADFPTPAARPAYSTLNCDKFADTFGLRFPPWEEGLKMAMEEG